MSGSSSYSLWGGFFFEGRGDVWPPRGRMGGLLPRLSGWGGDRRLVEEAGGSVPSLSEVGTERFFSSVGRSPIERSLRLSIGQAWS